MPNIKRTALILKKKVYREADLLLTCLDKNHGRFTVLGKGAKKPKSKSGSNYELLSLLEMEIYDGKGIGIIKESKKIWSLSDQKIKIHFYLLHYLSELLYNITRENIEQNDIFNLSLQLLKKIDTTKYPDIFHFIVFSLCMLKSLGYGLDLSNYSLADDIEKDSLVNSGFYFESPKTNHLETNKEITKEDLKFIYLIQKQKFETIYRLNNLSEQMLNKFKSIVLETMNNELQIKFNSIDFLKI